MEGNTIILAENLMRMLAVVIFTGILCVKLSHKIKLPDVVIFILAGIVLGPQVLNIVNNRWRKIFIMQILFLE